MKITSKTTIEDVILMLKGIDFWDQLETVFIPVKIPELTYGQRIDLSSMNTRYDLLFIPQKVLLGLEEKEVMSKPFISVYNYGLSVYRELERMTIRDEKTFKYNPTAEEVKAGFYGIDHGVFGVVDWIAQRLSISHEAVFDLPERRIYAMMKIDYDNGMYQRRLNQIISKQK